MGNSALKRFWGFAWRKRSYCQFDSKLAQIVQQQGRNGQLHIGFGGASSPDCRGITVAELQGLILTSWISPTLWTT
nr:conjugal transfer protein TraN [Klebsiella pneumoniae subsp. pneumoniae]